MTTNNAANNKTAASGKVLQGQGVGTASDFSTATYPSTATTTGQILRADGTNWVGTTATYPDTAGTSGNVLTSDGTNWVSSTAPGGGMLSSHVVLTSAQVKALHATPIQVVAAPGANKVVVPIFPTIAIMNYGTSVFGAAAAQTISLAYGTSLQIYPVISNTVLVQNFSSVSSNTIAAVNSNLTNAANLALNLWNPVATEITGNAGNDTTISVTIFYWILTTT